MEIEINARGNGACPLCRRWMNCPIHKALSKKIKDVQIRDASNDHPVEAVIYSCPAFDED